MQQDADDLEEVILFPDLAPPPVASETSPEDEHQADAAAPLLALRVWVTVQLAQFEGQLHKQKQITKPPGLTPELVAYFQAREVQVVRKASRDAYMKTLQKLDHFNQA